MKLGIIIGSTRDARFGDKIASWVEIVARKNSKFSDIEILDIKKFNLPMFNEASGPKHLNGVYANAPQAKHWAEKIGEADAFILVHAEHNHGIPASVSNALDYVYDEWNNKPIGFVSYGGQMGGGRATEHLRTVVAELQMADIRDAVVLPFAPFGAWGEAGPLDPKVNESLNNELDQLAWWSKTLKAGREAK